MVIAPTNPDLQAQLVAALERATSRMIPEKEVARRMGKSVSYVRKTRAGWQPRVVGMVRMESTKPGAVGGWLWNWRGVEDLAESFATYTPRGSRSSLPSRLGQVLDRRV